MKNGSRVCLFLYSVVLMGTAVLANEGGITTKSGYGANPDTTMGPSGTTGLNQISAKDVQSKLTMPTTRSTRATSGPNIPANINTPSRAYTKTSGQPNEAEHTPCPKCLFEKKDVPILLLVTGCLVVLCIVLLVSTMVLLCQVSHLKHKLRSSTISSRPTRSNVDLVSGSGHCGTGQKTKERPGSEPSETSLMMPERGKEEEPEKEVKGEGKDETAKAMPKKEEKEAATANGTSGSAENGAAEAATPSQESPVTTNQHAEPSDPAATTASPSSQASSDVVVG